MRKSFTVIAEGDRAAAKHPPVSDHEISVVTNDIEFRGRITNQTEHCLSVSGYRNIVKKIRGKWVDVRTPCVLHFHKDDILNLNRGSFTGETLNIHV